MSLQEEVDRIDSEIARMRLELATDHRSATERELDALREEIHRVRARTEALERNALGWRMVARGLLLFFTAPPTQLPGTPTGVRGKALRLGRRLRPVARRFPRTAEVVRRWIEAG
jgi:hypothetical protein